MVSNHPVPKHKLTFRQIVNMSFGFFGTQFGFALQNANVSRIFQTRGADIDKIGFLWVTARCRRTNQNTIEVCINRLINY